MSDTHNLNLVRRLDREDEPREERVDLSGLEMSIDRACELIDQLRAEKADLLTALRDLVDAIPQETLAADPPLGVWWGQAHAAIAKAEGR